jgi:hypothetical protein
MVKLKPNVTLWGIGSISIELNKNFKGGTPLIE